MAVDVHTGSPLHQALARARSWEQHYVPRLRRPHFPHSLQDHVADRITAFAGSMAFVYLHTVWFALWVALNEGLFPRTGIQPFDPFPFGLLTLIVSLEAIFLSTFVMIAQNRLSAQSEVRAQADYEVNLRAEAEIARLAHLLESLVEDHIEDHQRYGRLQEELRRAVESHDRRD
jgi:uncharacterized membrane protein